MILPTIDDFTADKPNCGNCTRKGGACARSEKRFPNGYVKSSVTGEISGVIYRCAPWTGRLAVAMLLMTATATAQTTDQVASEIARQNIPHPHIVLAQARLETGNFKSDRCRRDHNLFGIKHGKRYAKYRSWRESITDYKIRISSRYNGRENYYSFLKRIGYARDERYTAKLKHINNDTRRKSKKI